jgi:HK97 family phage major capsid protein
MNEEVLKAIEERLGNKFNEVLGEQLKEAVGPMVAGEVKSIVEKMQLDRATRGFDRSGLTEEQKLTFADNVKSIAFGTKALHPDSDNAGGYLVGSDIVAAIYRVAASVGLVTSQAQKWPMDKLTELGIPRYTGSFLEGEWLGYDEQGSTTDLTFGEAKLITKRWQLAFAVSKKLISAASVELADWLLALAAEALNNAIDKQAFNGTGQPFVGILNNDDVTVYTMTTGKTAFDSFDLDEASTVIGTLEESLLDGAAFYFNRTVWAKIRVKKDGANQYILPLAGMATPAVLSMNPTGGGVRVAGEILGFPVFTARHLPAFSASAVSTKFGVFGNFKSFALGTGGEMTVEQHRSGTFGGKEVALSGQIAMVYEHDAAVVVALPAAFVVIKTPAS